MWFSNYFGAFHCKLQPAAVAAAAAAAAAQAVAISKQ
jgi:hypothetical protein